MFYALKPGFVALALLGLLAIVVPRMTKAPTSTVGVSPLAITLVEGYRDWKLISVAREEGKLEDLRAILGNDTAINAAKQDEIPYPEGAIIVRLAWEDKPLAESAQAFGKSQSHIAGGAKNGIQLMIKATANYRSTGGWGFAQFENGKPANDAKQKICFTCHTIVKDRDFVFNRYAPGASYGLHP